MTTTIITTLILAIIAGLWIFKVNGRTKKMPQQENTSTYNKVEAEKFVT